ncbi:MAG: hypothetical protein E7056_00335 [Lentisphaerae bacterium]|nr:hypothetical protein [Lentisphaerota bacterium]
MQCTVTQVNEYFSCHLHRRSWQEIPEDIQDAAVKMAQEDIQLALGCAELDITDLLVFCAVCEQALFLAVSEYKKYSAAAKCPQLKSETVDGVGKREYYEVNAVNTKSLTSSFPASGKLAPRSELFLSHLPGYNEVRLDRG